MAYGKAIQALADPTRREVFERLRRGPQSVGRLADGLAVSRPAVSQHLKVLAGAGLITARRDGVRRIYSVEIRGLRELREYLETFWDDVLAAFAAEAEAAPPATARSGRGPGRRRRDPGSKKRRPRGSENR
jgi:DNA-binding transcriptional ArsR family regulator